ncbi:neutral ceramidase-like protein [Leptotrombidium deliense]|uniref:Neutral ceramidase n=1 Tax=Leptotrombidium deliense TaxID=299467 RepID=A0A443SEJ2_9ACAR|nr:neutral ceramidase-like protein [Leptotrombidium deliense]
MYLWSTLLIYIQVKQQQSNLKEIKNPIRKIKPFILANQFNVGTGIFDITGPAAELYMNMYGSFTQRTNGIHMRLFSRAFVIEDFSGKRICMVVIDCGMVDMLVKLEAIKRLQKIYGNVYTDENVMISATHTHSAPAGYSQYFLYGYFGFNRQNFDAIVNGIFESVKLAHNSISKSLIYYNEGTVLDVSINRSPTSYKNNPKEERDKYTYDTDKTMYILKFTDEQNNAKGVIVWFAVHPTSINNTNSLISSDNKGIASYLFEKEFGANSPGKGTFVAAFPNSNTADISPNIKGPICVDTGLQCDEKTSTCNEDCTKCIASGPGSDMYSSATIIGKRLYTNAKQLFDTATTQITGELKFIHQFVDMTSITFNVSGKEVKTCKPALGSAFAAGTVDGPGIKGFAQGINHIPFFWIMIRNIFFGIPTPDLVECHKPKLILLPTGQMNIPYEFQPKVVPTQMFQIGDVFIAAAPSEFTTMCGRRLKESLRKITNSEKVIYNGYANTYSSYVTTFQEYQIQRYEGGSTIYGPYTFDAYLQQFNKLATALINGEKLESGPQPPNRYNTLFPLHFPVIFDTPILFHRFGDCIKQPDTSYTIGSMVNVEFVSGHPKNDLLTGKTFLNVQRFNDEIREWEIIKTDGDPDSNFVWKRVRVSESKVTVYWMIGIDSKPGVYKIQHFGTSKTILQTKYAYSGECKVFNVI